MLIQQSGYQKEMIQNQNVILQKNQMITSEMMNTNQHVN